MNTIFFGTPDFALAPLQRIHESRHRIIAVVTAPDKERGRGRRVSFTPVKKFALDKNIPCLQPEKLSDPAFHASLRGLNADLFVIVAFRILPPSVFRLPKYGSFNLHGSLLPKYRGAAPIQWAIINGEVRTGLTTFFLDEKVDTGKIILRRHIDILPNDDFGSMHDKMSSLGADLIIETIDAIETGKFMPLDQDDSEATPAPKIKKEDTEIDFNNDVMRVHNLVRGLSPYPCAYFKWKEKSYKVHKTAVIDTADINPGDIRESKDRLIIGCRGGALDILEIQPEGRKRMTVGEFLRGYSLISA